MQSTPHEYLLDELHLIEEGMVMKNGITTEGYQDPPDCVSVEVTN